MDNFIKNDGDYMLLSSSSNVLFLFVHDYGSSPLDLLPLAQAINKQNYNCALLLLKGHGQTANEIIGINYEDWKEELAVSINYYKTRYETIYIVGFSLGATLAIDFAGSLGQEVIKGVVGISTYIKPKNIFLRKFLNIATLLKLKKFPRALQVTDSISKQEIIYSKFLPVKETKLLIEQIQMKNHLFTDIQCPTFLFHSKDDKISDYDIIAKNANNNIKLITFRVLNHYMQFDIPQQSLGNAIISLLAPEENKVLINEEKVKESFSHISSEANHWSSIIFQLIVGFFSIFGTLVYFSLPDILADKPTAPYYLTSYALLNCIFLILAVMYFFYLNRAIIYLKHYIEPYIENIPWVTYRTNEFMSGEESRYVTMKVSFVILGIPTIIATSSLIHIIDNYLLIYIFNLEKYVLLIGSFTVTLLFYIITILMLVTLQKYTARELYTIKPQRFNSVEDLNTIMNLFNSINIGCVKQ